MALVKISHLKIIEYDNEIQTQRLILKYNLLIVKNVSVSVSHHHQFTIKL